MRGFDQEVNPYFLALAAEIPSYPLLQLSLYRVTLHYLVGVITAISKRFVGKGGGIEEV